MFDDFEEIDPAQAAWEAIQDEGDRSAYDYDEGDIYGGNDMSEYDDEPQWFDDEERGYDPDSE